MRSPHQDPSVSVSAGLPGGVEQAGGMSLSVWGRAGMGVPVNRPDSHTVHGHPPPCITLSQVRGSKRHVTPHYGYLHSVWGGWCTKCHTSLWLPTLCVGEWCTKCHTSLWLPTLCMGEWCTKCHTSLWLPTLCVYRGNGTPSVTPHYGYLHSVCTGGMVRQVSHLNMATCTMWKHIQITTSSGKWYSMWIYQYF